MLKRDFAHFVLPLRLTWSHIQRRLCALRKKPNEVLYEHEQATLFWGTKIRSLLLLFQALWRLYLQTMCCLQNLQKRPLLQQLWYSYVQPWVVPRLFEGRPRTNMKKSTICPICLSQPCVGGANFHPEDIICSKCFSDFFFSSIRICRNCLCLMKKKGIILGFCIDCDKASGRQ